MCYKVLRVISGRYSHRVVFVGHHLPDLRSPQFQVGAQHRLELTTKFPKGASLLKPFKDAEQVGVFFCMSFKQLDKKADAS